MPITTNHAARASLRNISGNDGRRRGGRSASRGCHGGNRTRWLIGRVRMVEEGGSDLVAVGTDPTPECLVVVLYRKKDVDAHRHKDNAAEGAVVVHPTGPSQPGLWSGRTWPSWSARTRSGNARKKPKGWRRRNSRPSVNKVGRRSRSQGGKRATSGQATTSARAMRETVQDPIGNGGDGEEEVPPSHGRQHRCHWRKKKWLAIDRSRNTQHRPGCFGQGTRRQDQQETQR